MKPILICYVPMFESHDAMCEFNKVVEPLKEDYYAVGIQLQGILVPRFEVHNVADANPESLSQLVEMLRDKLGNPKIDTVYPGGMAKAVLKDGSIQFEDHMDMSEHERFGAQINQE